MPHYFGHFTDSSVLPGCPVSLHSNHCPVSSTPLSERLHQNQMTRSIGPCLPPQLLIWMRIRMQLTGYHGNIDCINLSHTVHRIPVTYVSGPFSLPPRNTTLMELRMQLTGNHGNKDRITVQGCANRWLDGCSSHQPKGMDDDEWGQFLFSFSFFFAEYLGHVWTLISQIMELQPLHGQMLHKGVLLMTRDQFGKDWKTQG